MSYQALYRKYRPSKFSEIIGQDHITTVLKNQVETDRVSHAYLFSGSRGTGKTSAAKILAKAVNCQHPVNGEPCLECEACLAAQNGCVDVIELDAASNNGVDDMRSLIEKAVFTPLALKKKVYIIDEAHMLTQSAFNALLKTLEEPPSHILFILATTEPRKILPTITSRCQRFDFKRLRVNDIVGCVSAVLDKAGASIEKEGLVTIARRANGGMRDALSLADQCLAFCGNNVSSEDVNQILGSVDTDMMFAIADALIASDVQSALRLFGQACAGRDIPVIVNDLAAHFRSLMMVNLCGGNCSDILDCTDDDVARFGNQVKNVKEERLMRALEILSKVQSEMKLYTQPRIPCETALVRICRPELEVSLESALDRLTALENRYEELKTLPATKREPQAIDAVESSPAVTVDVPKKPKKKRTIDPDVKKAVGEICKHLKANEGAVGEFICASLCLFSRGEITDTSLDLYYSVKAMYNTVCQYKTEIKRAFDDCDTEMTLNLLWTDKCDESDFLAIESQLADSFGDIFEVKEK